MTSLPINVAVSIATSSSAIAITPERPASSRVTLHCQVTMTSARPSSE